LVDEPAAHELQDMEFAEEKYPLKHAVQFNAPPFVDDPARHDEHVIEFANA